MLLFKRIELTKLNNENEDNNDNIFQMNQKSDS